MYKFLQSLFGNFSQKDNQNKNKNKNISCSLDIQMNVDGSINIVCYWPEFNENNKDQIISLANNYALMLDAINDGLLRPEIISTIKNYKSYKSYDILFSQNVYFKLMELSYLKQKSSIEQNMPVIRPSQVFKSFLPS